MSERNSMPKIEFKSWCMGRCTDNGCAYRKAKLKWKYVERACPKLDEYKAYTKTNFKGI
jgi:hypothetical protein